MTSVTTSDAPQPSSARQPKKSEHEAMAHSKRLWPKSSRNCGIHAMLTARSGSQTTKSDFLACE